MRENLNKYWKCFVERWALYALTTLAFSLVIFDTYIKQLSLVSFGLILLGIAPWVFKFIKSFELPGGFKFELVQRLEEIAQNAGVTNASSNIERRTYEELSKSDPVLALAALRIDIEKRLKELFSFSAGLVERQPRGLSDTVHLLFKIGYLNGSEYSAFRDLLPLLNSAIHSNISRDEILDWAVKIGPSLIDSLDKKIEFTKKQKNII